MATGKHYFIGEGVLYFKEPGKNGNGVDIKHGDVLPAAMPEATIAKLVKSGKASDKPPVQRGTAEAGELGRLRDQVQALRVERDAIKEDATRNSDEILRLQGELQTSRARVTQLEQDSVKREELLNTTTGERDAARDTVANLEKTIAEMTAAATSPTPAADTSKNAGPKK